MAVAGHVFPQYMGGVAAGDINMNGGTWSMALSNVAGPVTLATSGMGTVKTFTDWKNTIAAEVSGTGYTAGGTVIASPTWTIGGANSSVWAFTTATNPAWPASSFTANQAILYQSSAGTVNLACFWDFGGAVPAGGATFTLTVGTAGLLTASTS